MYEIRAQSEAYRSVPARIADRHCCEFGELDGRHRNRPQGAK